MIPSQIAINNPEIDSFISKLIDSLHYLGYLEAGVEKIDSSEGNCKLSFYSGRKVQFIHLTFDEEIRKTIDLIGIKSNGSQSLTYHPESTHLYFSKIIAYWENHGYPFAKTTFKALEWYEDTLHGKLLLDKGLFITFDKFEIRGTAKVSPEFLAAISDIKPGQPYSEKLVRNIDSRLATLPYLTISKTTDILFIENKAQPYVYLEHRNNDVVDGVIGMAPPSDGLSGNENLLFTGDFKLRLGNLFRSGKTLEIHWRSFGNRSQDLKGATELPFLFGSPLGLDLSAQFLKFDTIFTQIQTRFGFQYWFNGRDKFKIYIENQATNLLAVDTNQIKATRRLPGNQSMAVRQYGFEVLLNRLDYLFNPRKGYSVNGGLSAGTKAIRRDTRIESLKIPVPGQSDAYYNLYDSSQMKYAQYRYRINFNKFFPVKNRSAIKFGLLSEGILSDEIFFNELIRIGGVYSLRGFNEQSIFTNLYGMLTLEYRYLISRNSNFIIFWNGAWYEDRNRQRETAFYDTPYGFGAGVNLETGAGIFTFAYALGKEQSNTIRLQTGKIHFGLTSLF